MKHLALRSVVLVLLMAAGCTSNDRFGAGTQGTLGRPAPAATSSVAPASAGAAPVSWPSTPAANGGSSLPAAAPYSGGVGSASAQQNINPAPFLNASLSAGAGGTSSAPPDLLTRSADGTMRGPNDQPAASTGWGTSGSQKPSAAAAKPAAKSHRAAPKK